MKHNVMYQIDKQYLLVILFTFLLTLNWSMNTFFSNAFDSAHTYFTQYFLILLIALHIEDFSSQRLTIYRFLGVSSVSYLISSFTYHIIFFAYGSYLDITFFYLTPNKQIGLLKKYFEELIGLRLFFSGFSIIPIFYLLAFICRNLSDPYSLMAFIVYIFPSLIFAIIFNVIDTNTKNVPMILILEQFPFIYFKFGFRYDD